MRGNWAAWAVRVSWPVLAGAWGAWIGAQGYLALPHNADSFASMFALAFFSAFALIGFGAGILLGALVGGLAEMLLRRLGAASAVALGVATLLTVLACWQVAVVVKARYPGFRRPVVGSPATPVARPPTENPCARPPPENPRDRSLWDSECR